MLLFPEGTRWGDGAVRPRRGARPCVRAMHVSIRTMDTRGFSCGKQATAACARVSVLLPHAFPRPFPTPLHAEVVKTSSAPSEMRRGRPAPSPAPSVAGTTGCDTALTRSRSACALGSLKAVVRAPEALALDRRVRAPHECRGLLVGNALQLHRDLARASSQLQQHLAWHHTVRRPIASTTLQFMSRYVSHRHQPVSVATSSGGGARESRGPRR